jgi:hypothetical protein
MRFHFDDNTDKQQDRHLLSIIPHRWSGSFVAACRLPGLTENELIESLSFLSYRPVSTAMVLQGEAGSMVEMVIIDPFDLQAAQEDDAAMCAREMAY